MKNSLLLILSVLILTQCVSFITPDLESPCVSIESNDNSSNPCIRRPANKWLV